MKQEIRVLNRTLRWTDKGIEYEPDQRHAEIVIKQMELTHANSVTTPGNTEAEADAELRDKSPLLTGEEATQYRALAARLNYLALDRPDIQFSAKEISKYMATPRSMDWARIARVARYLVGKPRYVQEFHWQELPSEVKVFTDSNWAGDRVTRKSTSGGTMFIGKHLVKSWSSTQAVIAISSGEAELYALVRGAAQAAGLMSMMYDFGIQTSSRIYVDSVAALGIASRVGLGKTRHISTQYLWIQEKVSKKELDLEKVPTQDNPADALTKYLKAETLLKHIEAMGGRLEEVRAKTALKLNRLQETNADHWVSQAECEEDTTWTRAHRKPRLCLFTPMKVAKGPLHGDDVGDVRVTIGKYVDGEEFFIADEWKRSEHPHEQMRTHWTGFTTFR